MTLNPSVSDSQNRASNKPWRIPLIQQPMVLSRHCIPILLFFFSIGNALAQGDYVLVRFQPHWYNSPVNINQQMAQGKGFESLRISMLRFYISDVTFLDDNRIQLKDPHQAHLIDVFDSTRNQVKIDSHHPEGFSALCFTLGLDSILNTSGILEGDLDPVEGMYWTWQSGFIHFKLEGDFTVHDAEERHFEYHLGGYRSPHETSRQVCLRSVRPKKNWNIALALERFLEPTVMSENPRLMSPGPDAVRLIERAASLFEVIDEP